MINGLHPDLPLRFYASGNLGIVQPGYAKSYLVVAYRQLSGQPLAPDEQASILRMWHRRLATMCSPDLLADADSGAIDIGGGYVKLRAKVLGSKSNDDTAAHELRFSQNVLRDAFVNAVKTMHELISNFGLHSGEVKDWLSVQDKLFQEDAPSESNFPPLAGGAAPMMRQQRAYQIAAAQFYSNDLEKPVLHSKR
jgi:hypothetical protein